MSLHHSTRAATAMPTNSRLLHQNIPLHLLQPSRFFPPLNQQRHNSTAARRRTGRKPHVRYIVPLPGLRFQSAPPRQQNDLTDLRSFRVKRKLSDVHHHLVSARRLLGFLPGGHTTTRSQNESNPENSVAIDTSPLTHLGQDGSAHMVNISDKQPTKRVASAVATLFFSDPKTFESLMVANNVKGDAVAVARVAAIQAVKRTADLIPLAHPSLNITGIKVNITTFNGAEKSAVTVDSIKGADSTAVRSSCGGATVHVRVKCHGKTGIEMEALTGATIGVVTLYDMLKAVDKAMVISGARVVEKKGGKSGDWRWDEHTATLVRTPPEEEKEAGQSSIPSSTDTPTKISERSDVAEWNQGLADEFTVENKDEEQQGGDGERREGTPQQSLPAAVKALPTFALYRTQHLESLRARELKRVDELFRKLILTAKTAEEAAGHEKHWSAATQDVIEHYSKQIKQQVHKMTADKDDFDKHDALILEEAKRIMLQRHQPETRFNQDDFKMRSQQRYASHLRTGVAESEPGPSQQ